MVGFSLHSVLVDGNQLQVSYSDPGAATPVGTEIRTAVITLGPELEEEFNELVDGALQIVTAWQGLRRASGVPSG